MTERCVAFLRAVNIGNRQVRMERLRVLFAELGLGRVGSYIQSGNVFFDSAEPDRAALAGRIERHLAQGLGFAVPVFLRTVPALAAVLEQDPFGGREVTPDMRLAVTFLSEPAPADLRLPLVSPRGDVEVVHATAGELFVVWRIIDGRPPSADPFLGRVVRGPVTTRFLHTTRKILTAAQK